MKEIFFGALLFAFLFVAILWGVNEWKRYECNAKATVMGRSSQFGFITGCMIQHNGTWVPLQSFRAL